MELTDDAHEIEVHLCGRRFVNDKLSREWQLCIIITSSQHDRCDGQNRG